MTESVDSKYPTSAQALRVLSEHHIIIASENGTLYKFKQSMLPQVGETIDKADGSLRVALDILPSIGGGPIEADSGTEKRAYYALNCKAFQPPEPSQYEFSQQELASPPSQLPKHDFLIIPAEPEGVSSSNASRDVVWLVDREALKDHLWEEVAGQSESAQLENAARKYVLSTLKHGIGVGLYPAVQVDESGDEVIFCYVINCQCFDV